VAAGFTLTALLLYAGLCVATGSGVGGSAELKVLVLRLITLSAMGGLGTTYWRLVRRGRRDEARHARSLEGVGSLGAGFAPVAE
jgi:hypothetical protein